MDNKKKCREVRGLLERLLDGELDPHQEVHIKEEMAACEECRAEFKRLQKLRALMREVYLEQARTADLESLLPGVMASIEARPPTWRERVALFLERYQMGLASPIAPIGVAATAAVVVVAATLIYVSGSQPSSETANVTAQQVAEMELGKMDDKSHLAALTQDDAAQEDLGAVGNGENRRPRHEERPYRKNEAYITSYAAGSGIVVIDVDVEGDSPTVVWHLEDGPEFPAQEENRI